MLIVCLVRYTLVAMAATWLSWGGTATDLEKARDRQDRAALSQSISEMEQIAAGSRDPAAHYRLALARFYLAQVALEVGDKALARTAAEKGIPHAEQAVTLKPEVSEYHRLLGALCGQVIPANVLAALKYGKCARESIDRAIQLGPRSSGAYLARGIGNYYLPPAFGGDLEQAIADFHKAIELNPHSAESHLWLGIALRKAGKPAEARKAISRSLALNPDRVWAKQQLEKTPAQ